MVHDHIIIGNDFQKIIEIEFFSPQEVFWTRIESVSCAVPCNNYVPTCFVKQYSNVDFNCLDLWLRGINCFVAPHALYKPPSSYISLVVNKFAAFCKFSIYITKICVYLLMQIEFFCVVSLKHWHTETDANEAYLNYHSKWSILMIDAQCACIFVVGYWSVVFFKNYNQRDWYMYLIHISMHNNDSMRLIFEFVFHNIRWYYLWTIASGYNRRKLKLNYYLKEKKYY